MKTIGIIGAGLSSSVLIGYLLDQAAKESWQVLVADANILQAEHKIAGHSNGKATALTIEDEAARAAFISNVDLVISLLPPSLHVLAAKDCIKFKKHLITASYITPEMKALDQEAKVANVLLLNEMGLDPGIDHLSAMQMIHSIQRRGGVIASFKSYCGGLVSPEFDNNPWNYKFTWNPKNVVTAGQATARYLGDRQVKFIPPNRIFTETTKVKVDCPGKFEGYANRDSLSYIEPYGIESAQTVLRGTLRMKGFSESWNMLVWLGLTDDSFQIPHSEQLTYRELLCALVPQATHKNLENRLSEFLGISKKSNGFKRLKWLGLFEEKAIGMVNASPAAILLELLKEKWKLEKGELDMIVMKHEVGYEWKGKHYEKHSTLVVKGYNEVHTAMAKTVGLPMAIAATMLMKGELKDVGVRMPLTEQYYEPILKALELQGIKFIES